MSLPARYPPLTVWLVLPLCPGGIPARQPARAQEGSVGSVAPGGGPRIERVPPGALRRLGTLGFRQCEGINHLAYSHDGGILASASGAEVTLWDVGTGRPRARFGSRAAGLIYSLTFGPDGTLLALGSQA